MHSNTHTRAGLGLIELILATSVFGLFITGVAGAWLYGQESSALAGDRVRALLIAEEGIEAVRNMRDADFSNITTGTHGLVVSSGSWAFSGSSDTTGQYTRQVEVSDASDDQKEIASTVTWQQNARRDGEVVITTYLTNWQEEKGGQPDCTGPPQDRPPGCDDGGGGPPGGGNGNGGGGGAPDCSGPPQNRPPECN